MILRQTLLLLLLAFHLLPYASAQISVIGELSQERNALPGESYEGIILIRNDSDELQEAKVYQTDYTFHFSGTNNYAEPAGQHPRSNAHWVSFSPAFVTLPPMATVGVNYVVRVPRSSDTLRGTYWSMLMVEGIRKGSPESAAPRPDRREMGISQTIRYGIQVATTIAGTGELSIRFVQTQLLRDKGTPVLQVDIENTGTLGMRPEVYAELFDAEGVSRGRFSGSSYRLYPQTSVRQLIPIRSVSAGTYKVLVVVDAGGDEAFAAQYTLTL